MNHQGTVDKFIGDAVMAFWNAPADDPDHTIHACRAILACLAANRELNKAFVREGWPPYDTRFGLHVGDAVVGNIGSSDRMNYTPRSAPPSISPRASKDLNKNYGTGRAGEFGGFASGAEGRPSWSGASDSQAGEGICRSHRGSANCAASGRMRARPSSRCAGRWDEIYAAIAGKEGQPALTRLTAFLIDYPEDGVALYHAQRFRAAAQAAGAVA